MRRRWYYFKRMLQADRLFVVQTIGNMLAMIRYVGRWIVLAVVCAAVLYLGRGVCADKLREFYENYAVRIADDIVRGFLPAWKEDESTAFFLAGRKDTGSRRAEEYAEIFGIENENEALRAEWIANREQNQNVYGENVWVGGNTEENAQDNTQDQSGSNRIGAENSEEKKSLGKSANENGNGASEGAAGEDESTQNEKTTLAGLFANGTFNTGNSGIILEKLNDYDYLMKKFYNIHPTTTASRDLMQASDFLATDLSIEKNADVPQILIYHTHSQETYADYPENPEADVIHLGEELAGLLREKGYNVYHDESVYDYRNGKLDRSAAYTYALDGITGLLQKYPSIQVVLDIHRDGVADGTRLVTEVDGTETAKIMFFNGTSMSPDGPIEYLPNPNLKGNLAFSFQMQLLAAEKYPGFTRKIYLKGLRYNEHVRARSALIEVGAQTNTYAEAKAAMAPLSDLLDQVLTYY